MYRPVTFTTSVIPSYYFDNKVNPPIVVQEQKEEDEMNYAKQNLAIGIDLAKATETEHQRRHLLSGMRDAYDDKLSELSTAFGLTDDDAPRSYKDFIARILAGDIQYDGTKSEDHDHGNILYHIRWRAKDKKEDRAGYKAAKTAMSAAYARAKDEIIVLPLEAGLAAKRAFEEASFLPL